MDREEVEGDADAEEEDFGVIGERGSGSGRGRKKRSGSGKGRISRPRGSDWWASIDNWFAERVNEWGEKLDSPEWKM